MNCPRCGAKMPEGKKFCTKCGTPLGGGSNPAQQPTGNGTGGSNMKKILLLVIIIAAAAAVAVVILFVKPGILVNHEPQRVSSRDRDDDEDDEDDEEDEDDEDEEDASEEVTEDTETESETETEAESETETESEDAGGSEEKKQGNGTALEPSDYYETGGTWGENADGGTTYQTTAGRDAKNVWVKEYGEYYYIDATGCKMTNNYTSDGWWVDQDGAWDPNVERIPFESQEPPLEGVEYVRVDDYEDPVWTFEIVQNGTHWAIGSETFGLGYTGTFDVMSLGGANSYLLTGIDDPKQLMQMSVSMDQKTIIITMNGFSEVYRIK